MLICDHWFHTVFIRQLLSRDDYIYIYCADYVSSYTHTLNTTYTSTHNNTQL